MSDAISGIGLDVEVGTQLECVPRFSGSHRCLFVSSLGASGSTWLAKVLNSHPEVCCYHESVLTKVYPATEFGEPDILSVVRHLAEFGNSHGAYRVVGDVGSIWATYVRPLRMKGFVTALLVRHPARILLSRLRLWPTNPFKLPLEWLQYIEATWGIKVADKSELDQVFLLEALSYASQARHIERGADICIRIEDLNDVNVCSSALETLTGIRYERTLLKRLIRAPVNQRSGVSKMPIREILGEFSNQQREWYQVMLATAAHTFGYSLNA